MTMQDQYGRNIHYLRVSVTDRCNLRCRYCMPEGIDLLPMKQILSLEQIEEICTQAAALGISRIKVTGGEPLVRKGVTGLIARLKQIPGIEQVTMTSNGVLLEQYLPDLLSAGLDAVNISLDTLDADRYRRITGRDELETVRRSLYAAVKAGLRVKVNAVLQRDINADEWQRLAELAKDAPLDVRFIEMMPIGFGKQHAPVYNDELLKQLEQAYPGLTADPSVHGNGPAVYYRIPEFQGSVGLISAMHGKFCADCNRIRLTSVGKIKPCLCYGETVDLKAILDQTEDPEERSRQLSAALQSAIYKKPRHHCFEEPDQITEDQDMIRIGG